ncbi:GLPGLI family protein [Taibaiella chishuiensis]|uniref:GLPGLI family protein n=1 Tax=Taibaiella chishuiensis TaxID=1434707 RepID=A0A2P8CWE1_9BACT|nr:GLPGLI family protein [Taibaiella chishuiensis]PSK89267.1 GLPGLI family protein [Taibaiella chishuiensis]
MLRAIPYLLIALLILAPGLVSAQFAGRGKITYERKTNVKQKTQTEKQDEFTQSLLSKMAPVTISEFSLAFDENQSRYQFEKEREVTGVVFGWGKIARENTVFTDFRTGKVSSLKQVYENNYLVEDSIRRFRWKIEDEVRVIAGYNCRKAVTRICDSVVVVAFYSEQILVSGGPEGFNGLPGMILGLAIPRLYTTWFASAVTLETPEIAVLQPGRKQKKASNQQLLEALHKGTDGWDKDYTTALNWWLAL